ncbi:MAG TPA: type IV secretion system protein [Noviherbaspirillum sp.]
MDLGFVYFAQIFITVTALINNFSTNLMTNIMGWVSAIAITLFTLWITIQGYRILTGQSRESMLGMVLNMSRTAIILIFATTTAFMGANLQSFVNGTVFPAINGLVSGSSDDSAATIAQSIDKNLAYTQVAMAFIEGAEGLNGTQSGTNVANAGSTTLMAVFGLAGPPITAGALLLSYQIALALFIGLGPLFIMCLIFDQTKSLFQGWLMFGLGTMFSMAVLNVMVTIVLKITLAVATALWVAGGITAELGLGSTGLNNQAMQQGGIGMLMTALIVSAPAMAGRFFSTLTNEFRERSAFGERYQPQQARSHQPATPHSAGAASSSTASSSTASSRPNYSLPPSNIGGQVNRDVIAGPDAASASNMA